MEIKRDVRHQAFKVSDNCAYCSPAISFMIGLATSQASALASVAESRRFCLSEELARWHSVENTSATVICSSSSVCICQSMSNEISLSSDEYGKLSNTD